MNEVIFHLFSPCKRKKINFECVHKYPLPLSYFSCLKKIPTVCTTSLGAHINIITAVTEVRTESLGRHPNYRLETEQLEMWV